MTNLYADTEFNGHQGELISLALVGDDGSQWYGIALGLTPPPSLDPWVADNVIPKLRAVRRPWDFGSMEEFRASLKEYLLARSGCTIWADWPADFAHLMRLMSGPAYAESFMIPCTMVLLKESDPKPEIPHNALSDAIALMEWHKAQGNRDRRLHDDAESTVGTE
jgi:hypothetical protein